jgi:uncharacterized protein involved in oxidation of intracellular sulfur
MSMSDLMRRHSRRRRRWADAIQAPEFPTADLIEIHLEQDGVIHICGPCAKSRGITPDDLIDGASIVAAGTIVQEFADATDVAVY